MYAIKCYVPGTKCHVLGAKKKHYFEVQETFGNWEQLCR